MTHVLSTSSLSTMMVLPFRILSRPTLSRRLMSSSSFSAPLLLTPAQVHDLSKEKKVSFLDASWFMPKSPRKPYEEFVAKRIPGAHFLDLDEVASHHELGLKHMMPEERVFADACGMPNWTSSIVIFSHPENSQRNME